MPTVYHYLEQQATAVRASAKPLNDSDLDLVSRLVERAKVTRLILVGSGTSSFAATAVAAWAERLLPDVSVRVTTPTEPLHYWPESAFGPESIVIAVSQSGRSRLVLDTINKAAATGARTLLVTGEDAAANAADVRIDIRAGEELVGAKTKGYTSTIVTLLQVIALIAGVAVDLTEVPEAVDAALEVEGAVDDFAGRIDPSGEVSVLGSGPHLATAREAALKIMEIARIDVASFDVEEYIHGPHRRLTPLSSVIVIAVDSPVFARCVPLIRWLLSVTQRVLVITDRPDAFAETGATIIAIRPIGEDLSTVPAIIPLQRLALAYAARTGVSPEEPLFTEVDSLLSRKDQPA